jgi:hypothetical protein
MNKFFPKVVKFFFVFPTIFSSVAPGQPYYYKFTVVKSEMTESDFS